MRRAPAVPEGLALDASWLATLDEIAHARNLALAPGRLATELRAVSDAYNSGAFDRSRSSGALAARLAFFFPRDVPKIAGAVRELVATKHLVIPRDRSLRVLDVGAGLGASTWGLARMLAFCGQRGTIESTLVDADAHALEIAKAIASAHDHEGEISVRITTRTERFVARKGSPRFDVVLVGQALGEMRDDETSQFTVLSELLTHALEPDGSLVVVEPALRDRTQRLHRVRDRLIAETNATVFAPCLHARACPALAAGEWCHEDLPIDLPSAVASLARAAGLRWQGLTFAYLVLRKDGVTLAKAIERASERVVSSPIVTKGKREFFLCGHGATRRKVSRLDRDAEKNDAWSTAERGDVLALDPPLSTDSLRVPKGTKITIER